MKKEFYLRVSGDLVANLRSFLIKALSRRWGGEGEAEKKIDELGRQLKALDDGPALMMETFAELCQHEKDRIFFWHFYCGLSLAEIAHDFEIDRSTAWRRLLRAANRYYDLLEVKVYTYTSIQANNLKERATR